MKERYTGDWRRGGGGEETTWPCRKGFLVHVRFRFRLLLPFSIIIKLLVTLHSRLGGREGGECGGIARGLCKRIDQKGGIIRRRKREENEEKMKEKEDTMSSSVYLIRSAGRVIQLRT